MNEEDWTHAPYSMEYRDYIIKTTLKCLFCDSPEGVRRRDSDYVIFECGTRLWPCVVEITRECLTQKYERQLAAKDAEIARLGTVLTHIAEHGGTTDNESGLSHNGSWCSEQARCALEAVK